MNEDEIRQLKEELGGLTVSDLTKDSPHDAPKPLHPALKVGLGTAFVCNVALLLSLPPVLRGRGAPYLPTFSKSLNSMFAQLRQDKHFAARHIHHHHHHQQQQHTGATVTGSAASKLTFVDLGSGDGRIVFRASREGLFHQSIGYEINPLLHVWASVQRIVRGPRVWSSTRFYLGDLWGISLKDANVVAVYGLAPIMKDLGVKLQNELPPDSYVLSNVFTIPGWKPSNSSVDGTFIYRTPDCWQDGVQAKTTHRRSTMNV